MKTRKKRLLYYGTMAENEDKKATADVHVGWSSCLSFLPSFHSRVVFLLVFIPALFLYFTPRPSLLVAKIVCPIICILRGVL